MTWAKFEGTPYPLGISWCGGDGAYNFAVYSKHATDVRLLLFGANDLDKARVDIALDPLRNKSGRVWHCRVPAAEVDACRYYGYVVAGPEPTGPFEQHSFHPEKLLLDPYARRVEFPRGAPLGRIAAADAPFPWADDRHPRHESSAVIYELHVRNFTRSPTSGVADQLRGTFAGVIAKIPYLRELGVTIVELMPVFQFDPHGHDRWGYMPLGFFAPHGEYAPTSESPIDSFRAMVKALHEANIEIVLDVVYNHTAEGGESGPIYSFKGFDNSTYYLTSDGGYANYSGCGNSLNVNNQYVRKMILDSMRYWVRDMHVDGFRFDLASVFARGPDGTISVEEPPIFGDISSDPLFYRTRLIAEPWDAGGAYALGRAFPGHMWMQWNSAFRDDVRRFVRGDAEMTGALVQRVYGSDDLFPDDRLHAYHAYQSVNYVTSHDGFTLHDLVSYSAKQNPGGPTEEWSACTPPELREQQARNFIALLMLSNGTPMLRAGDEMLQTQQGHNNPYDVDDATTWLDWSRREQHAGFWRFVQQMIAFRKRHPSLARSRFWRDDVEWFGPRGVVDFASQTVAWYLDGASVGDRAMYVMVNSTAQATAFVLQRTDHAWHVAVDTSLASPDNIELESPPLLERPSYCVAAHSVVVLVSA